MLSPTPPHPPPPCWAISPALGLVCERGGERERSSLVLPLPRRVSDGESISGAPCRPRGQQAGCGGARARRHGSPAARCPRWPAHGCRQPRGERGLRKGGKSPPESTGWSSPRRGLSRQGPERVPGAEQGQGGFSQAPPWRWVPGAARVRIPAGRGRVGGRKGRTGALLGFSFW